jgi:hypothetical protein
VATLRSRNPCRDQTQGLAGNRLVPAWWEAWPRILGTDEWFVCLGYTPRTAQSACRHARRGHGLGVARNRRYGAVFGMAGDHHRVRSVIRSCGGGAVNGLVLQSGLAARTPLRSPPVPAWPPGRLLSVILTPAQLAYGRGIRAGDGVCGYCHPGQSLTRAGRARSIVITPALSSTTATQPAVARLRNFFRCSSSVPGTLSTE